MQEYAMEVAVVVKDVCVCVSEDISDGLTRDTWELFYEVFAYACGWMCWV